MQTAFLFDLDGTLIDNMHYHLEAWKEIAAEAGSKKDEKTIYKSVYGKNTEILARILDDRHLAEQELIEMVTKKDARYRELYRPHLALIDGLQEFLDEALKMDIRMAIASGSTPENVDMILDGLKIRHYFDAIVTGAEVTKSKPDPATFTMAAARLSRQPADCIVFEDMPQGVEAAQRGGMSAVAVLTSHPKEAFEAYPNLLEMIPDYRSIGIKKLIELVRVNWQSNDRSPLSLTR